MTIKIRVCKNPQCGNGLRRIIGCVVDGNKMSCVIDCAKGDEVFNCIIRAYYIKDPNKYILDDLCLVCYSKEEMK